MKRHLLTRPFFETLILKPDVDSVIAELGATAYKESIEKASVQYSGIACIEVALRKDFSAAFSKLVRFMKGDESEKYIRILVGRWDVQNIKTILRGKNIHVPSSEILECMIPAGELDEVTLSELIKQPDIRAVIDLLATWGYDYAKPLTKHFREFSEKRDLTVLEYALDRYYYKNALNSVTGEGYDDRLVREMIMTEIDVTNIKNVLRMVRDRIGSEEGQEYLIEGGIMLGPERLLSMVKSGTLEGAMKLLEPTPYRFLAHLPEDAYKTGRISVLEKELETYLVKQGTGKFLGDPLSIAIPIAYIWAKFNEITNIRIIARCKITDVPEKEVRKELIYV